MCEGTGRSKVQSVVREKRKVVLVAERVSNDSVEVGTPADEKKK